MASAEAINQGAERVRALGGKPPLRRKPGATNLFLETDQRRLLFYEGGAFTDGVRRYTPGELREILRADPSRLTPAAGLRPVLQDLVLPTAGFVVGPNEFRYVAELSRVYALHGLSMPALFLRVRGVVLEPPIRRILERYRLDPWALVDRGEEAFLEALRENLEASARWKGSSPGFWRKPRPWRKGPGPWSHPGAPLPPLPRADVGRRGAASWEGAPRPAFPGRGAFPPPGAPKAPPPPPGASPGAGLPLPHVRPPPPRRPEEAEGGALGGAGGAGLGVRWGGV